AFKIFEHTSNQTTIQNPAFANSFTFSALLIYMIIRFSTYIIFASLRSRRSLSGEAIFSSDLQPTASSGKVLPAYRLPAACLPPACLQRLARNIKFIIILLYHKFFITLGIFADNHINLKL
ncbi:MAG: hypothetical protein PHT92_11495, partial [Bacteroidales bacterium]|nr:hypothetical protein [Bacteroidales bacterium]